MPLVKPPSTEPTPVLHCSFKVYANEENKALLKDLKIMAARDGKSFSDLIRDALSEYHEQHRPGNPQLVLGHWSENLPMPKSIGETKPRAEADPMEGLRALPTSELIRQLSKMERADRRSELRTSIEMLLHWMASKA